MPDHSIEVTPLSIKNIRRFAEKVRKLLGITKPYLPIIDILELILPTLDPEYSFEVRENSEMGENHGLTYTKEKTIVLKEDVYIGACNGNGRDRLTAAHEFGHLLLHQDIPLARSVSSESIPAYRSSEWQANCFAGEILVSHNHINKCNNYYEAVELFGVSESAAQLQWERFKKDKIINK